ncbi:L-threonine aldolase [Tumebacillus sp. BK434]|uniref:threonine aldolase family protein n=1 Tax=Tumebacillus sp. BK434 TaxID=2512169 RepID=UPI0010456839|nr:GntG family PLP-dependent aldolase [Tumebacillus sp. BK434]TCP54545.1 L-threonine aldolase [Tumebacillus sp. BK434]
MYIDLRSDTVTKPTAEMRKAMFEAEVGDDVMRDDPTVIRLEETAAEILGKEAALYVSSGTLGNQIAIQTLTRPGDEIILEQESHIYLYEGAGHAVYAGVNTKTLPGVRGAMNPEDVQSAIRTANIHHPRTGLICVENTHNKAGGTILPLEHLAAVSQIAKDHGIPVHMDGARLFNAVVGSGHKASAFTQYVDTVQVCFSKGLGAPVGSVLAGSRETIEQARYIRKRMGGGMRQAGVIAAPALIALTKMVDRLAEDHANAKLLANGLAEIKGLQMDVSSVDTNIVIVNVANSGLSELEVVSRLKDAGVLCGDFGPELVRFVTHKDVTTEQIHEALVKIRRVVQGAA